jgi:predicted amino acid racemase
MLLEHIQKRNPALIEAAVQLHQEGKIPPNTWLYDLDVAAHNGRLQAEAARKHGLTTYIMTKQYARNPMVSLVAIKQGMYKTVAVDIHGARMMHRYRVPVGHIGHLNQVPKHAVAKALAIRPDVITVYSVEAARRISDVAGEMGLTQEIMMRVYKPGDVFFPGQEGGFRLDEVVARAREIQPLPNVRIVGVTSFPCVSYHVAHQGGLPQLNPNMETITTAARELTATLGIEIKQINAPGNTSIHTFPVLAQAGATHVEPGTGLLGTSRHQLLKGNLPELPGYVYVSEVSHHYDGRAYAFAGGLWSMMDANADRTNVGALVGSDPESAKANCLTYEHIDQSIDYHISLLDGSRAKVGDTVVMPMTTQAQMTRSHGAAVSGISSGKPVVWGIFDHATTMLDDDYNPVPVERVRRTIDDLLTIY